MAAKTDGENSDAKQPVLSLRVSPHLIRIHQKQEGSNFGGRSLADATFSKH